MRMWPGHPHPLGAIGNGERTHFALLSQSVGGATPCPFDRPGDPKPSREIPLEERTRRLSAPDPEREGDAG